MKDLAIEQLYACAAKIIESLRGDLAQDIKPSARKDVVAMLQKLANLLLQLNKLEALCGDDGIAIPSEDRLIIEEFLKRHKEIC